MHNVELMRVYIRLKKEQLYISCKKFQLFTAILDNLGCKVDSHGVHADSNKMAKLHEWHEPQDHREVLWFLGLIKYLA